MSVCTPLPPHTLVWDPLPALCPPLAAAQCSKNHRELWEGGCRGNPGWLTCQRGYSPRGGQQFASSGFPEPRSCLLRAAAVGISLSFPLHLQPPKQLRREFFSGVGTSGCSRWQAAAEARSSSDPSRGRKATGSRGEPEEDARPGPQPRGCGVARRQVKVKRRTLRRTAGPGTTAAAGTGGQPGSGASERVPELGASLGKAARKAQGSRGGGSELGSAGGRCRSWRTARPSASPAAAAPCLPPPLPLPVEALGRE